MANKKAKIGAIITYNKNHLTDEKDSKLARKEYEVSDIYKQ